MSATDDSASERRPLGLAEGVVEVAPYHPAWPSLFEAEAARLQLVLARHGLAVQLEHMGSTAVPGLPAKPIIDMLGAHDVAVSRTAVIAALVEAGYVHRGEQGIPGRDFFRRGVPRQYHLHLTELGSPFWHDHRAFRDHLRAHPAARDAYAALKQQLAEEFPRNRPAYIDGKTAFVRGILTDATRETAR